MARNVPVTSSGDGRRDLGEREPGDRRRRREAVDPHAVAHLRRPGHGEPVAQDEQRAHRVDGGPERVGLAEDVVEDLQRQRARVSGGQYVADERRQVERALAGEEPVVAAPLQHVHGSRGASASWRKNSFSPGITRIVGRDRCRGTGCGSCPGTGPSAGWSGAAHDAPRVVERVHEPAPGKRFVRDPDAAGRRAVGERVQLLGGEVVVVHRVRRHRRADQHACPRPAAPSRRTCARRAAGSPRARPAAPPRSRGTAGRGRSSGRARRTGRGSARATTARPRGRSRRSPRRRSRPAPTAASLSSSVPDRHTVAMPSLGVTGPGTAPSSVVEMRAASAPRPAWRR